MGVYCDCGVIDKEDKVMDDYWTNRQYDLFIWWKGRTVREMMEHLGWDDEYLDDDGWTEEDHALYA